MSKKIRLKLPLPRLDDFGIGMSCGYINTESYIFCNKKKQLILRVQMDSKSAVDILGDVWKVRTIKFYDRKRWKYRYKVEPVSGRARMILDASERYLSDEKKEQYNKAKSMMRQNNLYKHDEV